MNILTPDKSNLALRYYHTFAPTLIPMALFSYVNNKYNINCKTVDFLNAMNIGYHSYVSSSSIISDYIKHPNLSKIVRISNLKLHIVSTLGIYNYIYNINSTE
tara:strand:- start:2269 stop:2577 length:309 start_codon:yes stop_codon:yes gene_type:complete